MSVFKKGRLEISEKALSILQMSTLSTAGYLVGKNNKSHIADITKWYSDFNDADGVISIQEAFQDGISSLAGMISDDPFLQLQVKNAMSIVEISVDGPETEADLGKYQEVVSAFMSGVMAVR